MGESLVVRSENLPGRRNARSLYSPQRHRKIVRAVRKGNSLGTAGLLAGLGKDTIHDWVAKARNEPDKYPEYAKLLQDIEHARALREQEHIAKIERVALSDDPKTWTAAAWMLERSNPADWGRKDRVQVDNKQPVVQVNQVVLTDADVRDDARTLLRRATAIDASPHEPVGVSIRSESEED